MKTPQRHFVVEYKSARRRLAKPVNAIWGDTDLKALVNAVEADAPHLFASKPPLQECGTISNSELEVPYLDNDLSDIDPRVSLQPMDIAPLPAFHPEPVLHVDSALCSDVKTLAPVLKIKPKTRGKAISKFPVDSKSKASISVQSETPLDELASLEEENLHLRQMLARHLREENGQLRNMLERFVSPETR